jgi:cytochrome c1
MKFVAPLLALALLTACREPAAPPAAPPPVATASTPAVAGGNAANGLQLMTQYGCNVCHSIPGVQGEGTLAPSLAGLASRPTISLGAVQNTPANLLQFVQDPSSMNPQSGMPPPGISPAEAQDIVAFLSTLK